MRGCVGALDGYLLLTNCPSREEDEVANVNCYYSEHSRHYGLNVQAIVDAHCRFMTVAVAAPGGADDEFALLESRMIPKLESLPLGMFVVGDNAYLPSEHLLVPFRGSEKNNVWNAAFNSHHDQLRSIADQAFSLLTYKFQILKAPLSMRLANASGLFMAITRIHNFCIDENTPPEGVPEVMFKHKGTRWHYVPSNIRVSRKSGYSILRDYIVEELQKTGRQAS